MRDIRSDLKDRATLLEEQINATHAHFEKRIEKLQVERDSAVAELKGELGAVGKLLEAEHRRLTSIAPQTHTPAPPPPQQAALPPLPLADYFVRKLSEIGPMSKEDLRAFAVKEGYFPDADAAGRGVHATLVNIVRGGRIRHLSNGMYAPPSLADTIRMRQMI